MLCRRVYRIVDLYPETATLFSGVNVEETGSPAFRANLLHFTYGLDIMINLMDDPTVLYKEVEHMTDKHAVLDGMKGKYFTVRLLDLYL